MLAQGSRLQILDPTDHPDERQAYPKKLSLNPKIFSIATKVMLKFWAVCDRQVSGIYLFLQLNMDLAVSYLFRYCNTLPSGSVLTSNQARSHLLMWDMGHSMCVMCMWVSRQDKQLFVVKQEASPAQEIKTSF